MKTLTENQSNRSRQRAVGSRVEVPLRKIGTLPAVAIELVERLNDPESDVDEIINLIKQDPSLAIRVLKVVNSSYYGMPRQVGSIDQAVILLGLNAIKSITVVASFEKFFFAKSECAAYAKGLWRYSVAVATASREVARIAKVACPEAAFLAGLTHDIGIIYQLQAFPSEFTEMVQFSGAHPGQSYCELEARFLESNHQLLGAVLCREWNLPESLEVTAGFHHDPTHAPGGHRTLATIIHVAAKIIAPWTASILSFMDEAPPSPDVACRLALEADALEALAESLPDKIEQSQGMLGL